MSRTVVFRTSSDVEASVVRGPTAFTVRTPPDRSRSNSASRANVRSTASRPQSARCRSQMT